MILVLFVTSKKSKSTDVYLFRRSCSGGLGGHIQENGGKGQAVFLIEKQATA